VIWMHRIAIYLLLLAGVLVPWAFGGANIAGYCWAFIIGLVTGVTFMFIATGSIWPKKR